MQRFDGKSVLITGGARGIGFATAQAFLEHGARVAICSRHAESLKVAETQLAGMGEVLALHADVRHADQVKHFIDSTAKHFGSIDVLVANAGRAWVGQFARQTLSSIDEIIDVNLKGLLYTVHAALPKMLKQDSGVIVNVSSGLGKVGLGGYTTYCASKFGVVGFTDSLAQELEDTGVQAYAVCPGAVATDMQLELSGEKIGIPPEHVAHAILKLAGSKPPIRSGECLEVYR